MAKILSVGKELILEIVYKRVKVCSVIFANNPIVIGERVFFFSGPVFVEFPIDTLYPYHMVSKEVTPKQKPKGLMQAIVNW